METSIVIWSSPGIGNAAAREDPEAETRGAVELRLGEAYEAEGRLKEAEASYVRVLREGPQSLHERALIAAKRVIRERSGFWPGFRDGFYSVGRYVGVGVGVLLVGLILWPITAAVGKKLGAGCLEVNPLVDATTQKLGSAFSEVVAVMLQGMHYHFAPRGVIRGEKAVPMIVMSEGPVIAELAGVVGEAIKPEWLGKTLAWLLRRLERPEYLLRGSIEGDAQRVRIAIRVEKRGHPLQTWDRDVAGRHFLEAERDLAFDVLMFLKEFRAHENAA